jgi:hypothetical protein
MLAPICAYSCLAICTGRTLVRPQGRPALRRHLEGPDDLPQRRAVSNTSQGAGELLVKRDHEWLRGVSDSRQ